MKVAIVHEWLTSHAGSEKVVEQLLSLYPNADLYSLVDFLPQELRYFIQNKPVHTSFLQRLPRAKQNFRSYLPLMPLAIEQFNLAAYDLVISSNHAVAKGVLTGSDQLHISYVHTPIRYAWDLQAQYLEQAGLSRGVKGTITRMILHYLRLWDHSSASRVDRFVANSHFIARRLWKTYRRHALVIFPPVDVKRFQWDKPRENFYFVVSRFVPYKRVDLIVEAFNRLKLPLVVIGDGPLSAKIPAGETVQLLGRQPDAVVTDYMQRCRAFVFAAQEDFGITLVEAQAAGAPVIAFGKGGACDIVQPGQTGLLFTEQTVDALVQAIQHFEADGCQFSSEKIRKNADRFSTNRFQTEFRALVEKTWVSFCEDDRLE